MQQKLIIGGLLLLILMISGCSKDQYLHEDKYSLLNYRETDNPFENTDYCFGKAKIILGDDVSLFMLRAIQEDTLPHLENRLNWMWYFIKDDTLLEFDIYHKIITERVTEEMPMGYEYIYENDRRLDQLHPVSALWDSCTSRYHKPLLYVDIYIPLVYPPASMNYYFVVKDGIAYLGVDLFIYDALTGEDVTHQ